MIEELHSAHLNFWSEAKPTSGQILSSNSGRSLTATWTQALVTWDRHRVWHTKSQSKNMNNSLENFSNNSYKIYLSAEKVGTNYFQLGLRVNYL